MDEKMHKAFDELTAQMSRQHEQLLDRINTLARDFQNTKGFLVQDALAMGRDAPGTDGGRRLGSSRGVARAPEL